RHKQPDPHHRVPPGRWRPLGAGHRTRETMSRRAGIVLLLWLLAVAAGVVVAANSRYNADMSFFLPSEPTPGQQVMVDQLKEGAVSRLLMVGIEGGDEAARADLSVDLRQRLQASGLFLSVQN